MTIHFTRITNRIENLDDMIRIEGQLDAIKDEVAMITEIKAPDNLKEGNLMLIRLS